MGEGTLRALGLCLLGIFVATAADAAPGDTNITVSYKVRSVRIKPQPVKGDGSAVLRAVLHADGTVDDVLEAKGGKNTKKFENKDRKLGSKRDFVAQWRVIDANTLERKSINTTFDLTVKVMVDGKKCKADVGYMLHPGQKEYVAFSPQLDQMAHYSLIKPFDVRCKIE